ncbi:MAG: type II toxin-antitoxin system Phd/YefM family antitoxin [Leptolinea sp.]|jgi:prevent-host-death family protein|nr:type II toxin-antitoxin system Phd/YefM family antitoxin [Leptolinea sp.]
MPVTVSATYARIHLGELFISARHEPVFIERDGKPLAVLLSQKQYDKLNALEKPPDWRSLVNQSRDYVKQDLAGRLLTLPEDVLTEIREDRNEQSEHLY